MTHDEIKIELVKAIEDHIWEANSGTQEAEILLSCVHEYEFFLVRTRRKKATKVGDLSSMVEAVSNAQQLLVDLAHTEQEQMFGWQYGNLPENDAQAIAGVLVLITTELSAEVYRFMRDNPSL